MINSQGTAADAALTRPLGRPVHTVMVRTTSAPTTSTRVLWFLLVGWWLTAVVSVLSWLALVSLILAPFGLFLIERIPWLLTLRERTVEWSARQVGGTLVVAEDYASQRPWFVRAAWLVLVGWWASALAMVVGYVLILTVLGIPYGLRIYDRVPTIATLLRY